MLPTKWLTPTHRRHSVCMFKSDWGWNSFSDVRGAFLMSAVVVIFLNNADVSWCVAIFRPFILHCHPIRCQHCLSMGDGQVGVFTQCLWIFTKDWYYSKSTHTHFFFHFWFIFGSFLSRHIKLKCNAKIMTDASKCSQVFPARNYIWLLETFKYSLLIGWALNFCPKS